MEKGSRRAIRRIKIQWLNIRYFAVTRYSFDPEVHLPAVGWAALAFALFLSIALTNFSHHSLADGSGKYAASNVIGEFNAVGGAFTNFIEPTNQHGMGPNDVAVDMTNHRLIVDDGGNSRILIYNLDTSNNLLSTTPSYVLGQPDATTMTSGYTKQSIGQNTIGCSSSMAFDQANDRLFVSDECDSRVLVFDFSGGISNDMNASHVLGEPNFTTGFPLGNGETDTQSHIKDPYGLAYDAGSQQLFVADYNGNRVLIFDLSSGISDGMNASHVLGEPNFTTQQNNASPTINASLTIAPNGVAYDSANKLLYVSDAQQDGIASIYGGRVLVFDLSSGITDGMAASHVLGQPNFTSDTAALTQSGMNNPGNLLLDTATNQLFVSDSSNDRDLVFNLSGGITDGMNASFVLGEPNFTTRNLNDATVNGTTYSGPRGFGYDPTNKRLYVSDSDSRLLTLDLSSGVSNDMSPTSVLGQTDFSGNPTYTSAGFNDEGHYLKQWPNMPNGTYVDTVHHLLYVADDGFGRIMVYPLSSSNILAPDQAASYVLGQPDFTTTAVGGTTQTSIPCPDSIAGDPSRNLLFIDDCNDRVLVFDTSGGLSNGMAASHVIGQTDFTSSASGDTQNTFDNPFGGMVYDPTTKYLYVGDSYNTRVMVFNTTTISDGMNASYVLGQTDFTSNVSATTQNGLESVEGLALDVKNHELFVADNTAARVLVFNVSTISNGMNASFVLGEPNFTTDPTYPIPDTAHTMVPQGLAFDQTHSRLFIEDAFDRVLVFDLSGGIANNMDATGVIGQPDFTTDSFNNTPGPVPSKYSLYTPGGLTDAYDPTSDQLYVSETYSGRVMVFSFAHLDSINSSPTVGDTYSQVLGSGTQGSTNYAFASGTLPTGLTFNTATGLLSGTVTTPGTYNFGVSYTDNNATLGTYTDLHNYSVTVASSGGGGGTNTGGGANNTSGGGSATASSGVANASSVSAPVSVPTAVATPSGLVVDINLQDEQTIPQSGYTVTFTPETNTDVSLKQVEALVDGKSVYTAFPDLSGSARWDWRPSSSGTVNLTFIVTDSMGRHTVQTFTVSVAPPQKELIEHAATAAPLSHSGGSLLDDITLLIAKLPNAVVQLIPYFLLILLAIDAAILLRRAIREWIELRLQRQLLEQARNVNMLKTTFVQLASHYLRTPVTIIRGATELLGSDPAAKELANQLKTITDDIGGSIEPLIKDLSADESNPTALFVGANEPKRHIMLQPVVFVPILLVGVVCLLFDYLARRASKFDMGTDAFIMQAILFSIGVLLLYSAYRYLLLRRRDNKEVRAILDSQLALSTARDKLIADASDVLAQKVDHFNAAAAKVTNPTAKKLIQNGSNQLGAVIRKFQVAKTLPGVRTEAIPSELPVSELIEPVRTELQGELNAQAMNLKLTGADKITISETELVRYVLKTVLQNAIAYKRESGDITITVSGHTITVSDQGIGIPADRLTMLFEPFFKAEGAETFSHEGMGFSLYLDKLIMSYIGGAIAISSVQGEGTVVTITLR